MRSRLSVWWSALALALCLSAPLSMVAMVAMAQETEESGEVETAEESRATAFVAMEGPQTESVPGGALMVGSYAVLLALLVGYVARLGLLQRSTQGEVERLAELLEEHERS